MASILSGLLGPAINVATGAASAYEGAQANAGQQNIAGALQRAQIVRQQQQDAIKQIADDREAKSAAILDQLHQAQIGDTTAQAQGRLAPKPKKYQYITGPDGSVSAVNEADPTDIMSHLQGVQGKVENIPQHNIDPLSPAGQAAQIAIAKGKPKVAGAAGELNHARIAAAGSQIANADDSMTQFENDVLAGRQHLDAPTLELARKAMSEDFGSSLAYQALAHRNPAIAAYVRSAKEAAVAERMITPKGGSNATMQAEKILMQAGAGGDPSLIAQARKYRKTLRHALSSDDSGNSSPEQDSDPLAKYDLQ